MSMVEPGSLTASGTGDTPEPSGGPKGGGIASWSTGKKAAVFGGGGLLVLLVFVYLKKGSSANAANQPSSGTTPTLVLPSSNQDVTSSTDYASLTEGLNSLSNQVSQIKSATPSPAPNPPPTSAPAPSPANEPLLPSYYGGWKQVVGPAGQILDVVGGYNANRRYSGFEVGQGAPVYVQNPGGNWTLGMPGAQIQPGATFAVPTQFIRDVNTNPVTNAPPFG